MNYFSVFNPFFLGHLGVWAVASFLFFQLHRKVWDLQAKSRGAATVSDSEYQHVSYPLEKFENYFDLASSMFIFIGLIGTIYGFYGAVPNLTKANYDFADLRDALATSGFGILWSVILNVAVSVYHNFLIAPILERLQSRIDVENPATVVAGALKDITTYITGSLERSLTEFSQAARQVGDAASRLSGASETASKSFTAAASKLDKTADSVALLLQRSTDLPKTVVESMENAYQESSKALQKSLADQIKVLDGSSKTSASAFEKAAQGWHAADADAIRKSREQLNTLFDSFQKKLGETVEQTDKSIAGLAESFAEALEEAENRLPKQMQSGMSELTKRLNATGMALERASEQNNREAEALGQAIQALESGLSQLTKAATDMTMGRSPDIEAMTRELGELREVMEAQGKRTWWPFGSRPHKDEHSPDGEEHHGSEARSQAGKVRPKEKSQAASEEK